MSVLINDVCMPYRPLEMNFQKGQFTSALCNVLREHPNVSIDANSFDNGYSLFVFNVNSSHDEDDLALQNLKFNLLKSYQNLCRCWCMENFNPASNWIMQEPLCIHHYKSKGIIAFGLILSPATQQNGAI